MTIVPNFYTIYMPQNLMCVHGCVKLGAGGQQYKAMKAGVGVPARSSIYFHPRTKGVVELCLWQCSAPVCDFRLTGPPIEEKKVCM